MFVFRGLLYITHISVCINAFTISNAASLEYSFIHLLPKQLHFVAKYEEPIPYRRAFWVYAFLIQIIATSIVQDGCTAVSKLGII